jgi:hypothetical protein
MRASIESTKVSTPDDRAAALTVVEQVYRREKGWVDIPETEIPEQVGKLDRISWFLARVDGKPVGLIRILYDFPLELPPELEVKLERNIDFEAAKRGRRFAEVARFMIVPRHRRNIRVALSLMQAAITEVVRRGYTHLITAVYDGDPHSPLKFHMRVLGFERIGTHKHGELDCDLVRVILVLDIARAYRRLKQRQNRLFRELAAGLSSEFEALPLTAPL